jgi:MFS transporter, DHA3 family, macrolide efflux protein
MMKGTRPTFYFLLLTQVISLVGSRMTAVAMGIWVYSETQAATPLLLASFFMELPGMLYGSLAGVLVDRWNRRWVLILSDAGQASGTVFLLWSLATGNFQLWHLYLAAFFQGTFATFQIPAQNAVITLVVPEAQRERANGIVQMIFPFAGVLAPMLAGVIFVWRGVTGVITLDLFTFLAAVMIIALIRFPQPRRSVEGSLGYGSLKGELASAWLFLRARKPLLYMMLYSVFTYFMLNGPLDLVIPYLMQATVDERLVGVVLGLTSLGAFSGGLLVTLAGRLRPRPAYILGGMLVSGLMFMIFGTTRNLWVLSASLFVLFIPLPIGGALMNSILQAKTPGDLQGRIFALGEQANLLGSTTSFLLIGFLVDHVLEPAVGTPGWRAVGWLVGDTSGSGIGLLQVVTGVIIIAATAGVWMKGDVRRLEEQLADYAPEEECA